MIIANGVPVKVTVDAVPEQILGREDDKEAVGNGSTVIVVLSVKIFGQLIGDEDVTLFKAIIVSTANGSVTNDATPKASKPI